MKILFVCKHNRFRSKVAEALFRKYNKNNKNEVRSAGVALDPLYQFAHKNVVIALEEIGAPIVSDKSRQVDEGLIDWADKIIIDADNVNPLIFEGKDVEQWGVSDTDQTDMPGIKKRIKIIEKKVKDLIKRINKKQ